jgi:hypothetical protein
MESIFSVASRVEVVLRRSGRQRRDGALKMGWTKPGPAPPAMGIEPRRWPQREGCGFGKNELRRREKR